MTQYLSNHQQQLLDFITNEIDRTGNAPTYFEIARTFDFPSLSDVSQQLKILEQKGWIVCEPLQKRGIILLKNVPDYRLTILGNVEDDRVIFKKAV